SAGLRRRGDRKLQSRTGHWATQRHLRATLFDPVRHRLYQTLSRPRQIRLVAADRPHPDHRRDLAFDRARLSRRHTGAEPVWSSGDGLSEARQTTHCWPTFGRPQTTSSEWGGLCEGSSRLYTDLASKLLLQCESVALTAEWLTGGLRCWVGLRWPGPI